MQETHPAPTASISAGLAGSPMGGRKRTSFSVFMKEAPGPHCLFGTGVDVCIGVGGAQITPLQARPSFSSAGVSHCQIGGPSKPQFPLL